MNLTQSETKAGYYNEFGGAFVPELLYPNIEELNHAFENIVLKNEFKNEFVEALSTIAGRPSPLYFSNKLSKKYGSEIYLKREDLNHTGSHKINNCIGQILLAKKLGKKKIIAETGAGQHGVATATVAALFDMQCIVYMGEKDVERQSPNVARMKMLGAEVVAVTSGSNTLKDATNEAIRQWINEPSSYYLIGSVVGPDPYPKMVAYFQSIISEEIKKQLDTKKPNCIIACVGGGSNAAGAFYHFINDKSVELIGVEAGGDGIETGKTAATCHKGSLGIIHGCKTLLMQDEFGQINEPHSISAGLDYPGIGPLHAYLHSAKRAKYIAINDIEALEAGFNLMRSEGIIPALESAHALAALDKIEHRKNKIIIVNLSGRGDKDMATYMKNFN